MKARKLRDLKVGEFFTRKQIESPREEQVLIRCAFDQASKKYPCQRYSDICSFVNLSGDTLVYTDFVF